VDWQRLPSLGEKMTVYKVTTTLGLASLTENMDGPFLEAWIKYLKERHEVCEVCVDIKIDRPIEEMSL